MSLHRSRCASQCASMQLLAEHRPLRDVQFPGDALLVVPDLPSAREGSLPVGVRRERQRVQVRRYVARDPGVGVVTPDAAHAGRLLEHDPVLDPRPAQRVHHRQARETGPHDRDADVASVGACVGCSVCGVARWRLRAVVVDVVSHVAVDPEGAVAAPAAKVTAGAVKHQTPLGAQSLSVDSKRGAAGRRDARYSSQAQATCGPGETLALLCEQACWWFVWAKPVRAR